EPFSPWLARAPKLRSSKLRSFDAERSVRVFGPVGGGCLVLFILNDRRLGSASRIVGLVHGIHMVFPRHRGSLIALDRDRVVLARAVVNDGNNGVRLVGKQRN